MQKTGANLNALTRVAQYMNREKKKRLIMDAFLRHNLIIVRLYTWIFHNSLLNHEINRLLHERCLGVI